MLGPQTSDPGGMASVQTDLCAMIREQLGGEVAHRATYTSMSRTGSWWPFVRLVPHLVRRHRGRRVSADVAHLHVSQRGSFARAAGVLLALGSQIPVVITVHGSNFAPWARAHPRLARWVLGRAHIVTVLTSATERLVRELGGEVEVIVVPNFVEVVQSASPPSEHRSIVSAGVVSRRKGFDVLFDAWMRILPDLPKERAWRLTVAGPEGDVRVPDHATIDHRGVIDRSEVREILQGCRAGVLASRAEAMPMFVLETMAAGRPIVVSDIEDLRDVVGDGGVIVPPDAVVALGEALKRILLDDDHADGLGATAGAIAEQRFSDRALAPVWEETYRKAISGERRR